MSRYARLVRDYITPLTRSTQVAAFPVDTTYNSNLSLIRIVLAIYVLLVHMTSWYNVYAESVPALLQNIAFLSAKIFQSSGETNPAVLAFITLSGYCIHRNGLRIDKIDLKSFYVRRLFRIAPVLILGTMLGAMVIQHTASDPKIATITATNGVTFGGILYKLSGIFAFNPIKYRDLAFQGNAPLVTCSVEVWLYIFYPVLMFIAMHKGDQYLWRIIAAITLVGTVAYNVFASLANWWHNGSFFGFLIYWWIGVYALDKDNFAFTNIKKLMIAYIALTGILILTPKVFLLVEIKKIIFCVLFGYLLSKLDTIKVEKAIAKPLLESGFSIYALHTPLICLALFYGVSMGTSFATIICVAVLCYMLVESGFISLGRVVAGQVSSTRKLTTVYNQA